MDDLSSHTSFAGFCLPGCQTDSAGTRMWPLQTTSRTRFRMSHDSSQRAFSFNHRLLPCSHRVGMASAFLASRILFGWRCLSWVAEMPCLCRSWWCRSTNSPSSCDPKLCTSGISLRTTQSLWRCLCLFLCCLCKSCHSYFCLLPFLSPTLLHCRSPTTLLHAFCRASTGPSIRILINVLGPAEVAKHRPDLRVALQDLQVQMAVVLH